MILPHSINLNKNSASQDAKRSHINSEYIHTCKGEKVRKVETHGSK